MNNFPQWLTKTIKECGGASAACINLKNKDLKTQLQENGVMARNWIKSGYAGDMTYLERMLDDKIKPELPFPNAKSVIVITYTNQWGDINAKHPFPEPREGKLVGYISAYAKEQDYHRTGHQVLLKLHEKLQEKMEIFHAEACVDTRPVFERLLAIFGGLGIRGPNDLLRTPEHDVRAFIGTLFCDFEIPEVLHQPKMRFPCTFCQKCVKNCPTGAISESQPFDSNKCISYLAIEKKGLLNKNERQMLNDWLFGCDWCTVVCPPKDKVDTRIPIELEWLLKSSAGSLKRLIKGTAIEYAGVTKLRRNAIAILREKNTSEAHTLLKWAQDNLKSQLVLDQMEYD